MCLQLIIFHKTNMKYHPFEQDRKHFESIPHSKRSQYLLQVVKTPQLEGEPIIYHKHYPEESHFKYGEHTLHYYSSKLTDSPKAVVFFLHGLYNYGGNSGYLGVSLTDAIPNVNFYSLDFLNCGKSIHDCQGYIRSFEDLVSQGEAFVDHILSKFQDKPKIFLVGESLGGAVSFKMSLEKPKRYQGIIFLNPALREIKQQRYIMKKIGKFIGYLVPKLKITPQCLRSNTKYNTEDIQRANKYVYNDRHIPGSVRIALTAMEEIQTCYKQFQTPYILFQGGVDKSVDLFAPLDLEHQCKSKDKTTVYIKNMWHSTFYEQQIKDVTEIVTDWLAKRL